MSKNCACGSCGARTTEQLTCEHTHEHEHGHTHTNGASALSARLGVASLLAGFLILAIGMIAGAGVPQTALYLAAYALAGIPVLIEAGQALWRREPFNECILMSIATIGALAVGEYPEAVAVMLFYRIGEALQDRAVGRSKRSIQALMDIKPEFANVLTQAGEQRLHPTQVEVGARILVRAGERVPLDGRVIRGAALLDTSALTGESLPVRAGEGEEVLAGAVNTNSVLELAVLRPFGQSAVAKILELVENAQEKKAKTERMVTRLARVYTPLVVGIAAAVALLPPLFTGIGTFSEWLYRGLIFLVVSCPCGIVISVPLSFMGGIGAASRRGVLIKGAGYLEALANTQTVVFDKTGTLTTGSFAVTRIVPAPAPGAHSQEELLALCALAEAHSNHPIARAIKLEQAKYGELNVDRLGDFEEVSGKGVRAIIDGAVCLCGSARLLVDAGIAVPAAPAEGTVVHIAYNNEYKGYIEIADSIKPDAAQAVTALRKAGVRRLVMLTGDREEAAKSVANALGLDAYHARLLPHQKVERLEELMEGRKGTVFVGDGINDAPVLARADIGVAMGGVGSDAAIEAADAVIMDDNPARLADAIRVARKTRAVAYQNIVFALGIKALAMILSAAGLANMWIAIFADVGVAIIAILNAVRISRR